METLQPFACAIHHAIQRAVRHMYRHSCLLLHQLIQPAQQRAAAGQHDSMVNNVRRELWRVFFKVLFDRIHNDSERIGKRFTDLFCADRHVFRQTVPPDSVPLISTDARSFFTAGWESRTDGNLDFLRSTLSNQGLYFF